MANRRLIECKHRGCYKLTRNECAYCDDHIEEFEKKEKERRKTLIVIIIKIINTISFIGLRSGRSLESMF